MKTPIRLNSPSTIVLAVAAAGVAFAGIRLYAQRENVAGIRNFTKIDGSIASGGSIEVGALAELAKRGYKTVISLRENSESGAMNAQLEPAARAAGIRFLHVPMSAHLPSESSAAAALSALRDAANQPVFIYDASGSRAAAIIMIKRMLVDGWPEDRAYNEAVSLGLSSPGLKGFVLDYVARHK
jgi:uncharacterized protein (TIGR01244 family)